MAKSEIPISKTKIILPRRRSELLRRGRLLDILNERLDRSLIIVSAPPGYGKTSLLIDLAHESELTFCWLTLDPLDRDPQRFVSYLIAALAERFSGFGGRTRSVLSRLTSLEEGLEPLLVTLVNEMREEISEHFALVLDDFQFLDDSPQLQWFVNRLVRLMDENCHLILSSRSLPDLQDIALLVARDEVGGLDFSDLAFETTEIQALLNQNKEMALSDEEARQLMGATEGWITGIQFADVRLLRSGKSPFQGSRSAGVNVFDYLGAQVLDQQSPEVRSFLMRASMLEEFDAELCDAVLSPLYGEASRLPALLETIRRKNLFTLPLGVDGQWLRFHHLFRDYLQARFRREHPEEVTPVLLQLARVREERREWEAAYELYRQLGETDALATLLERCGDTLYRTALLTLEAWLNQLPQPLVRKRPRLLALRGVVQHMRGRNEVATEELGEAIHQLRSEGDEASLARALVWRGHAQRSLGRYDPAIQDSVDAMQITEEREDLEDIHAEALRVRGLALYRQGHTLQAMEALERSLVIHSHGADSEAVPQLMMETAMTQAALGEYRRARTSYEQALELARQSGNQFFQATLLNNLGFLFYQLGEYEQAVQALEEGLVCAQQTGYRRMEALICISMGDLYAEVEDFEIAGQNYGRARMLTDQLGDRFLSNYLLIADANLALLKRDAGQARHSLKRAAEVIHNGDSNYEYGHLLLAQGRLSLLENLGQHAVDQLTGAKACFAHDGREMESLWVSIWLAAAYAQEGHMNLAIEELGASLPNPNMIPYSAVVAVRQAANKLEILRTEAEARSIVRGLFDRGDRLDDQLPGIRRQLRRMARSVEVPAPALTIRAFGRGRVWVGGRQVGTREWQTQAVRELFFYFLAMNKPVTKEQVGSVLWPETHEPARLRLRFKNEMYRLRRAVGPNTILYEDEYYQLNPAADHEYDVEAFEAYLARARGASLPAEKIRLYEKAIDLVGGPYLEDLGATWVIPERERLHQAHVTAALDLAELCVQGGEAQKALQVLGRILEQDATSEAVYRLKMHIHGRLGDRASLIRTYRDCEESLQGVFGMPPSEETRELFRKLVS